jgi:hypothetical protein
MEGGNENREGVPISQDTIILLEFYRNARDTAIRMRPISFRFV